jgi:hypothetical protein
MGQSMWDHFLARLRSTGRMLLALQRAAGELFLHRKVENLARVEFVSLATNTPAVSNPTSKAVENQ